MSENNRLEEMDAFFTARVDGYDEHMLGAVEGCKKGYEAMARLLPQSARTLLDLGCGTGLELDELFKRLPDIAVTGVDMTQAMLDRLAQKHPDKRLTLICGSYLGRDFGRAAFDAVVSFETLHHLTREQKASLYRAVFEALTEGGVYVEADYMVLTEEEERACIEERERAMGELSASEAWRYHYDTPFTVEHQKELILGAGFSSCDMVFRVGNTTILLCKK